MLAPLVACIVALALYPGLILERARGRGASAPARRLVASTRMTFTAPQIDYAGLSPVIALTAGICAGPGRLGVRRPPARVVVSAVSLATLAVAAGLCIWQWGESADLVAGALRLDELGLAGVADRDRRRRLRDPAVLARGGLRRPSTSPAGHGEFQALLLSSVLGMVLLAQAQNLISFFVALELLSVPLYVLCGVGAAGAPSRSSPASST